MSIELETGSRDAVRNQILSLMPELERRGLTRGGLSPIRGGRRPAENLFSDIDPSQYARDRNHTDGAVTHLSPYIRHGVVTMAEVRDRTLKVADNSKSAEKLVQQISWRDYWQRLYLDLGEDIWVDQEDYKTGFSASDYADDLPDDIAQAETGVAAIDHFLKKLIETGWIHNHARLYVAAYVCHWRRVKWQAGARFFLTHLLDGDPASNNLSWQWVASTFSHKPYYFNLENIQNFTGDDVDTSFANNKPLAGSYEDLHAKLFPLLPPKDAQPTGKSKSKRKTRH